MPDSFDPYHKWLAIPPAEQPPHAYRLLGVQAFETDLDVIETAAEQRMALLRTRQTGAQAQLSQKLLNEVSAARVTLLNPAKKAAYDQQLKAKQAAAQQATAQKELRTREAMPVAKALPVAAAMPAAPQPAAMGPEIKVESSAPGATRTGHSAKKKSTPPLLFAAIGICVIVAGGLAFSLMRGGSTPNPNAVAQPGEETIAEKTETPGAFPGSLVTDSPSPPLTETTDPGSQSKPETPEQKQPVPTEEKVVATQPEPMELMEPSTAEQEPVPVGSTPSGTKDETSPVAESAAGGLVTADRLVIWNSHNGAYANLGSRMCNVLLLRNDQAVWSKRNIELPWSPDQDAKVTVALPKEPFESLRIEVTETQGFGASLSEVEIFAGKNNLAKGAFISGTGAFEAGKENGVDKLIDGITTSQEFRVGYWIPNYGKRAWVEFDVRTPQSRVTANRIVIWNQHNGSANDRGSRECNVTLLRGQQKVWQRDRLTIPWVANEDSKLELTLPNMEFERVRVEITKLQGGSGGLAEVEVYQGKRNLALGAKATANSTLGDSLLFQAANVTDGVTTSSQTWQGYWLMADYFPGFVEIDLSRPPVLPRRARLDKSIDSVVLWNQYNNNGDRGADLCDVILLDGDREVWRQDHIRVPWKKKEDDDIVVPLPKVQFTRVRVDQNWWYGSGGGLAEVEIWHKGRNLAPQAQVTASAELGPQFRKEFINDGKALTGPETYWLLPDMTPGWIELDLSALGPIEAEGGKETAPVSNPPEHPKNENVGPTGSPSILSTDDEKLLLSPPKSDELVSARKAMREKYADIFAEAKKPEEKFKLVEALIQQGSAQFDDMLERYVLLEEARTLAEELGNYQLTIKAIDALGETHQVNSDELTASAFMSAIKKVKTPAENAAAARVGLDLINQLAASNLEAAESIRKALPGLASKARDGDLLRDVREAGANLALRKKLFDAYVAAEPVLKKNPQDKAANLAVGAYLAVCTDETEQALKHLALGSDEKLVALVKAEAGSPKETDAQLALAEDWQEWGTTKGGDLKMFALENAVRWYEATLPSVTGLKKTKVDKDLAEVRDALKGTAKMTKTGRASQARTLRVVTARYKAGDSWTDVTKELASLVKEERLVASAVGGREVTSEITLKIGGQESKQEFSGGDHILIEAPGRRRPKPATRDLTILDARAGLGLKWEDVTEAVQKRVQGNRLEMRVNTLEFAHEDLAPGVVKLLFINWSYNGEEHSEFFAEGTTLTLGAAK